MANQTKENPINYVTMYLYQDTHSITLINYSSIEVFVEQPELKHASYTSSHDKLSQEILIYIYLISNLPDTKHAWDVL